MCSVAKVHKSIPVFSERNLDEMFNIPKNEAWPENKRIRSGKIDGSKILTAQYKGKLHGHWGEHDFYYCKDCKGFIEGKPKQELIGTEDLTFPEYYDAPLGLTQHYIHSCIRCDTAVASESITTEPDKFTKEDLDERYQPEEIWEASNPTTLEGKLKIHKIKKLGEGFIEVKRQELKDPKKRPKGFLKIITEQNNIPVLVYLNVFDVVHEASVHAASKDTTYETAEEQIVALAQYDSLGRSYMKIGSIGINGKEIDQYTFESPIPL